MDKRAVAYLRSPDELVLPPGLALVATIEGDELAQALELIGTGQANTLFTPFLGDVATSLSSLVRLLEWLDEAGAHLIAADVQLDTATAAGRRAIALLREIERWERRRGRPGLSTAAPELADRISTMREQGQSLHAIADALNRERIPTPRGGAAWRASSVQSVLGYRRPRPPAPGMRPPKPPKPPRPPHRKP
jgi:DNA invertase Pin-like site-specific DNA recombinase